LEEKLACISQEYELVTKITVWVPVNIVTLNNYASILRSVPLQRNRVVWACDIRSIRLAWNLGSKLGNRLRENTYSNKVHCGNLEFIASASDYSARCVSQKVCCCASQLNLVICYTVIPVNNIVKDLWAAISIGILCPLDRNLWATNWCDDWGGWSTGDFGWHNLKWTWRSTLTNRVDCDQPKSILGASDNRIGCLSQSQGQDIWVCNRLDWWETRPVALIPLYNIAGNLSSSVWSTCCLWRCPIESHMGLWRW